MCVCVCVGVGVGVGVCRCVSVCVCVCVYVCVCVSVCVCLYISSLCHYNARFYLVLHVFQRKNWMWHKLHYALQTFILFQSLTMKLKCVWIFSAWRPWYWQDVGVRVHTGGSRVAVHVARGVSGCQRLPHAEYQPSPWRYAAATAYGGVQQVQCCEGWRTHLHSKWSQCLSV